MIVIGSPDLLSIPGGHWDYRVLLPLTGVSVIIIEYVQRAEKYYAQECKRLKNTEKLRMMCCHADMTAGGSVRRECVCADLACTAEG